MESYRFDGLARSLATLLSRRKLSGLLALGAVALPGMADGKKRHHKHKRKKKKIKRNTFGCVDVGKFCKHNDQCCSGICQGKKDKKKCKAHDTGGCQAGSTPTMCGGENVDCMTTIGEPGTCGTTTGNAGYCFNAIALQPATCSKDADCRDTFSATAACIRCGSGEPLCVDGVSL